MTEREDDSITLHPNKPHEKLAGAKASQVILEEAEDITLFDKTSYEEKKIRDPLVVDPDKHVLP